MSDESSLPADVIEAIRSNRKIEAIKLLREDRNLGLKEAKETVDAYVRQNPHLEVQRNTGGGLGRLVLLILGLMIFYALYKKFV